MQDKKRVYPFRRPSQKATTNETLEITQPIFERGEGEHREELYIDFGRQQNNKKQNFYYSHLS